MWLLSASVPLEAASFQTPNFVVSATGEDVARDIAERAERFRTALAQDWFGAALADWSSPCSIQVDHATLRMSGSTTYRFRSGQVLDCRMSLRGSLATIVDTLLPHEVAHTVLVTHFGRAVPRWADEGLAVQVEGSAERLRLRLMMNQLIAEDSLMPLDRLLRADEYPTDRDELRILYLQAGSLTEYLTQAGTSRFVQFVESGMNAGWESALAQHYGLRDLAELDSAWRAWLAADRPRLKFHEGTAPADVAHVLRAAPPQLGDTVAAASAAE